MNKLTSGDDTSCEFQDVMVTWDPLDPIFKWLSFLNIIYYNELDKYGVHTLGIEEHRAIALQQLFCENSSFNVF